MDRVDEPHLTGGKAELMQRFAWPILDNKLLKHPGIGFKIMLPQELHREVERETRRFTSRLAWTNRMSFQRSSGQVNRFMIWRARMLAVLQMDEIQSPKNYLGQISTKKITRRSGPYVFPDILSALYRILVDHCNRHTDAQPEYQIRAETFSRLWRYTSVKSNRIQ